MSLPARPKTLRLLWFAALVTAAGVLPAQAQPGPRPCLAPSGGDDTARLQAALDRCSGAGPGCRVALCAGRFETGILRVRDFRGTLRGAGMRLTTLRARPELPVNPRPDGFFRDDPFGPDPWPYLLQFVEGRATIQDLGVLVPAPPAPARPTTGWALYEGFGSIYELRGAILLTGRDGVDFAVQRVRVEAQRDAQSEIDTTAIAGIEFAGLLFDAQALEPFPVHPLGGNLRLTDSVLVGVTSGSPISELGQATVQIARNRYRSAIAVDMIDLDRSQVAVLSNRWRASYRGVQVLQNLDGAPSAASEIQVDDNRGTLAPIFAGFGDAVAFQDPFDASPVPGGTVLRVSRNRFSVRGGVGPAASGVSATAAAGLRIADNQLSGPVAVGLAVDVTSGCRITGNLLGDLEAVPGPDLLLGSQTSGCLAVVSRADVVQDLGSGNRIIRR